MATWRDRHRHGADSDIVRIRHEANISLVPSGIQRLSQHVLDRRRLLALNDMSEPMRSRALALIPGE